MNCRFMFDCRRRRRRRCLQRYVRATRTVERFEFAILVRELRPSSYVESIAWEETAWHSSLALGDLASEFSARDPHAGDVQLRCISDVPGCAFKNVSKEWPARPKSEGKLSRDENPIPHRCHFADIVALKRKREDPVTPPPLA